MAGGVHGRGAYVAGACMTGAVHGRSVHGRGHAWQGACVAGGTYVACMPSPADTMIYGDTVRMLL